MTEKQNKSILKKILKILGFIVAVAILLFGLLIILVSCDNKSTNTEVATEEVAEEEVVEEVAEPESEEVTEPESEEDSQGSWTREQKNAYKAALSYLEFMSFSRQRLIDQLSSPYADQYPFEVAEFVVSAIEEDGLVDWNAECEEAAENYLDLMAFSKQELIDQLCSEYGDQFTREQAEQAVEKVY